MDAPAASATPDRAAPLATLALVLAALTVLGSYGLTHVLGLLACPLCFYQRTFAMALLSGFAVGRLARVPAATLCALGLPLALGGCGVAVYHVTLELRAVLDCPAGLFGLGSAPQQSLAGFLPLVVLTAAGAWIGRAPRAALGAGAALGLVFAWLSCVSNPPLPKPAPKFENGVRVLKICERHWDPSMGDPAAPPAPAGAPPPAVPAPK